MTGVTPMISWVAIAVSLSCSWASAYRIWLVLHATRFDLDAVTERLGTGPGVDLARLGAFRAAVRQDPAAEWERHLLAALDAAEDVRPALINEQLMELDFKFQAWSRVPRVCASLSSTSGLLLATLVLRRGFSVGIDLADPAGQAAVWSLVGQALTVVAFGLVGTTFAIAAHRVGARLAAARAKGADQLVERLERSVTSAVLPG